MRVDRFTCKPAELQIERGDQAVLDLLADAKRLAQAYRRLTGKPLGITGEVAEFEAAQILGVKLTLARQEGYDATEIIGGRRRRLQIKGRVILPGSKPGQRLGGIKIDKPFDAVLMVLLNEEFNATAIYEADRALVVEALTKPGSKSRNERGALAISKFRSIGRLRWERDAGADGGTSSWESPHRPASDRLRTEGEA